MACTHYPLLAPKIKACLPSEIRLIGQGEIVAKSLADYFVRHPEMEVLCSKNRKRRFLTTDQTETFEEHAKIFLGRELTSERVEVSLPTDGVDNK